MHWWQRLRSWWPGALRQQITRTGLIYALTVGVVATAAFLSANNLLFLILAAMLSVLLISGFVSKLGLAGLEIDLLLPEHISARRKVRGSIRLKNLKRWMPSFSIRVEGLPGSGLNLSIYFPVLPGGATIEEPAELFFPRRGRWRERTFQFTTRFPFGFAERRDTVTTRHEIVVYPCLDPRPEFEAIIASVSGELEARRRGSGHDFYRIRPYTVHESARHVDWKATAHTGALQVREFARDEDVRVGITLDLDVPHEHDEWFESAVECAACVAYRIAGMGAQVRFRTAELDVALPSDADVYTILKYLALVSPKAGAAPLAPDDASAFELIFTVHPQRWARGAGGAGRKVRVLGPGSLPPIDAEARAAGSSGSQPEARAAGAKKGET